jgi:hypothetical protein
MPVWETTRWNPFETTGYTQEQLDDEFGYYAMKNVTWDYSIGEMIGIISKSDCRYTLRNSPLWIPFPETRNLYSTKYLAPRDYGYNVIPLSYRGPVILRLPFRAMTTCSGAAGVTIVAVDASGAPRYSDLYSGQNETVTFTWMQEMKKCSLWYAEHQRSITIIKPGNQGIQKYSGIHIIFRSKAHFLQGIPKDTTA